MYCTNISDVCTQKMWQEIAVDCCNMLFCEDGDRKIGLANELGEYFFGSEAFEVRLIDLEFKCT